MVDRVFRAKNRIGDDCEFELKSPGLAEENEGERQYRVAYSKSLAEGVYPREKLREVMREHNMWTAADDKELKKAVGKIAVYQLELRRSEAEGNQDECMKAARGIAESRKRMWELFLIQQSVYMNSAEGVSEMIKTEVIMAACTIVKSTGKRYWENYAEYVRERDLNMKSTVYSKVVELQSHILDEARLGLMQDYPEQKYLKSLEDRMIDREIEESVVKEIRTRAEKAINKTDKVKKKGSKRGRNLEGATDQPK